jgi:hypothetical protein
MVRGGNPFCINSSEKVPVGFLLPCTVVGGEINHQCVVQFAHFFDMVDDPSDVMINMFQESGIDLHLP